VHCQRATYPCSQAITAELEEARGRTEEAEAEAKQLLASQKLHAEHQENLQQENKALSEQVNSQISLCLL